jgi:hypothetical protein
MIGRELYSAIIQPHFQHLYEAEVEEGKSGWAARSLRAKQRWLQHTSAVTVATGNLNFRILATMHHEWRAPTQTPGTSTSAHTHTRAQAASTSQGGNRSGLGLWKRAKVFSDAG